MDSHKLPSKSCSLNSGKLRGSIAGSWRVRGDKELLLEPSLCILGEEVLENQRSEEIDELFLSEFHTSLLNIQT